MTKSRKLNEGYWFESSQDPNNMDLLRQFGFNKLPNHPQMLKNFITNMKRISLNPNQIKKYEI